MRGPLVVLLVVGFAGGGYYYVQAHPDVLPSSWYLIDFQEQTRQVLDEAAKRLRQVVAQVRGDAGASGETDPADAPTVESTVSEALGLPPMTERTVTLYLHNGGIISGEEVARTTNAITLRLSYGDISFQRREILRLVKGRETGNDEMVLPKTRQKPEAEEAGWPYEHDVVFRLMNGSVIDAQLQDVVAETLVLVRVFEGGGKAEQRIPRDQLDYVLFRPIEDDWAQDTRARLQETFPEMDWYEDGMFSLRTDSLPIVVPRYRRAFRELSTEFFLTFHELLKNRRPANQQFLVIFDDYPKFLLWSITHGPGAWVAGYYSPTSHVFYSYNVLGEQFADRLASLWLGQTRAVINQVVDRYKHQGGRGYEMYVEGWGEGKKKQFATAHSRIRQMYWRRTISTLRHEVTHALFHNVGLQSVEMLTETSERTREATPSPDQETDPETQVPDDAAVDEAMRAMLESYKSRVHANNSWFTEGLAQYMEAEPIGAIEPEALSLVQEALAAGDFMPIEFLMAFRVGSFRGVEGRRRSYAYAQGWVLTHFLMTRHRAAFFQYLERLATTPITGDEDVAWLLEAVEMDLRTMEQEFLEYVQAFPPEDSPPLKRTQIIFDLREGLRSN